jgi:hypothetical protein
MKRAPVSKNLVIFAVILLIDFTGAHHAAIIGPGALDSNGAERISLGGNGMSDILLSDFVMMRQYEEFHTWLVYADHLAIRNIKLVSAVRANGNDGVDFGNSQHVVVDYIFVFSGDDCLSPKLIGDRDVSSGLAGNLRMPPTGLDTCCLKIGGLFRW